MPRSLLIVVALCLTLGLTTAKAQTTPQPVTPPSPPASYAPYPEPDAGYVTDLANLLTPQQEERIEQWLWDVESRSGVEIVVVTIGSIQDYPGTSNGSIEAFAAGLFNTYGVGNLPNNDGVLLVIAARDRAARIELGAGHGAQMNRRAEAIMQNTIIPAFRKDDYAKGITEGVKAIMLEFAGTRVGIDWRIVRIAVAIPILAMIAVSLFRNGKRGWGWVIVGMIIVLLLVLFQLGRSAMRHSGRSSSSGTWSAGGFGGGFGGGFSGGGGATGRW